MTPPTTKPEPAGGSVLERVRSACAAVAADAELVRIDHDRLVAHASTLLEPLDATGSPTAGPDPWAVAAPALDAGAIEHTVGLVLALDAINFGSGYHPLVRKRPGCSGATTMALALRDHDGREPVTAAGLSAITAADAHRIFDQPDDGGPVAELMGLFAAALADLGTLVQARHGGSFTRFVAAAGGSAAAFVDQLDELAFFHDVAHHHGRTVPLYKRAQLAVADLDRALPDPADRALVPPFRDADRLTAFADNLVPHVLRVDGVLRYDAELAAAIDAGEPLAAGSVGEVEIRAVGVHAVELLRDELATRGVEVWSSRLDQLLWTRGGGPRYKAVPRHRTRSTAY